MAQQTAQSAQPDTKPFSPAQAKRMQEFLRRLNAAQTAFNEFAGYLAEEHGVMGDAGWQLDVERGAWVRVPTPPPPNGAKAKGD